MRDYQRETEQRVAFIRRILDEAQAAGIVYGNSGGKDSALVGILCKIACEHTLGVMMPCGSKRNYEADMEDALLVAQQFGIACRTVDLSAVRASMLAALGESLSPAAVANLAPRLRMAALYAVAANEGRLVVGTGNRSEGYMGYFTKWGDGAFDLNPIGDLTVTEIYQFLRYLGAPAGIIEKAPSAGLFDGQTDECEMGISYATIDAFLLDGYANRQDKAVMNRFHQASEHKRRPVAVFGAEAG